MPLISPEIVVMQCAAITELVQKLSNDKRVKLATGVSFAATGASCTGGSLAYFIAYGAAANPWCFVPLVLGLPFLIGGAGCMGAASNEWQDSDEDEDNDLA